MRGFSTAGRDLSGWGPVLDIARSMHGDPALRGVRAGILYSRQMPESSPNERGSIDVAAGTSVSWNRRDDDLDHVWQARRIERLAPGWRSLLPSSIDFMGYADAECSIEIEDGVVTGYASREDGEDTDSTLTITHRLADGAWVATVDVSWACDDPDSDVLAMTDDEVVAMVEANGWHLHGVEPIGYSIVDGNFTVVLPHAALANIDRDPQRCAA